MKRILFFIALLFTLGASAQTYNPVNGTLSNKPYAPAQAVPTDMRSFFYDSSIFTFRAYQDTIEVLSYLNLPKWRGGNFLIDVHSGGVLNADGTYTGGTIEKWWFKDGVADINLVPFTGSGSGGGGGSGISSVTAINGLSNVNDSTVKWGGNPLIENTRIRGDNFSLTIDSLKSFTIATYPSNRGLLHIDTADVYISGKGSRPASASLQLLPNNSLTYGSTSLGTARLIGTTGSLAQIVEVNGSAISFVRSGSAQAAKVMLKYSDSLTVDSIANIAVWDSDTLKSADVSEIIAGGIDSIFITQTDSIFIISGNDTIFVGILDNIRDTADLVQGYGIYINNADSTYSPNGFDVLIAVDTSRIATKYELSIITNSDTAVFIVDSIANAPTGSEPPNTKYLVGTSPTGVFASHANDVAELIGAVWTFTDPVAQQQLIVDNAITYASYQYDGAVWNQTSVLWRVNGNTALGQTAFLGKISKERMPFRSWNKEFMYGDTTRDVYLPKLINTPSFNYLRIDSLTGQIDTAMFRPLIAGTGISIDPGPVGDTIKATGGGDGSQDLQSVTDVGPTTTNSFGILSDDEPRYIAVSSLDANNSIGLNKNSGVFLNYFVNGETGQLKADNITGTRAWQLPNASGNLALSVNGNTADAAGNISVSVGGSATGNYGNLQINRNGAFATPASDSLSFFGATLINKGATQLNNANGTPGTDSVLVQSGGIVKRISPAFYTDVISGGATQIAYFSGASTLTSNADFTYASSVFNVFRNNIGVTITDGITAQNSTAATVGAQQQSPQVRWTGQGWKTNATAGSQPVDFGMYLLPVQGTANPTWIFNMAGRINGGAWTNALTINSNGIITGGSFSATANVTAVNVVGSSAQVQAGAANATLQTYRLVDGGTIFTPKLWAIDGSTANSMTWHQTHGLGFNTRQTALATWIETAAINITNVVQTVGAETSDLSFYTKPTGGAAAERLRITGTGNILINTTTDIASSKLTVESTTQGFLPPRMTATQASAIASPAEGLLVYVTNTNGTFTAKGWWGYDGAAWQKLNN